MFFIAGIYPKKKELDYYVPIICKCCGRYGRYEVFVEYNAFSLFFIPLFKFGKKYYAKTTCCNSIYLIINKEKGYMIEKGRGQNIVLNDEDLMLLQKGIISGAGKCPHCGCEVRGNYKYCPNCGNPL